MRSVPEIWKPAGWESPEDFQAWWVQLVRGHPNPKANGLALQDATQKILAGKLPREAFERGYARHKATWEAGFEPNLYDFVKDSHWELPERQPRKRKRGPESQEEWTRRVFGA